MFCSACGDLVADLSCEWKSFTTGLKMFFQHRKILFKYFEFYLPKWLIMWRMLWRHSWCAWNCLLWTGFAAVLHFATANNFLQMLARNFEFLNQFRIIFDFNSKA